MTVAELIEKLQQFPMDIMVIIDDDGNTSSLDLCDIEIWNEADSESPVAIYY